MSLIDEIVGSCDLTSIEVPEWAGTSIGGTVYHLPFSLADADYASKMAKGKDGEFIAYVIIRKVLDENGKQHFSIGDKAKLMRKVDPDVLSRIVVAMKGDEYSDEVGNE